MSETTLRRLSSIQSHLASLPRSGRLAGKVCIVTGAGSGIGRASVWAFAHQGAAHIYALDYDDAGLPSLKAEVEAKYGGGGGGGGADNVVVVTTHCCDCADEGAVRDVVKRVEEEQGRLDVFFANAGIVGNPMPVGMLEEDDIAETLRVNVLSCFHAIKYASPLMKATHAVHKPLPGGSIILTASVAGLRSGAGPADYSASKAAVINLASTSAWQLSRSGIRVNAVCPGLIETGMTRVVFDAARQRGTADRIGQLNPSGRYGVPEEVAAAVLFLASDEASYVNGVALPVCGGLTASLPVMPGKMA